MLRYAKCQPTLPPFSVQQAHCHPLWFNTLLSLVRFDYCRFIELDYVPMESSCMVSMRPTKGYVSTKSPTKGYTSTKSPDRHGRSTNSPSTPRSRSVPTRSSFLPISPDPLKHGNGKMFCTAVNVLWRHILENILSSVTLFFFSVWLLSFSSLLVKTFFFHLSNANLMSFSVSALLWVPRGVCVLVSQADMLKYCTLCICVNLCCLSMVVDLDWSVFHSFLFALWICLSWFSLAAHLVSGLWFHGVARNTLTCLLLLCTRRTPAAASNRDPYGNTSLSSSSNSGSCKGSECSPTKG